MVATVVFLLINLPNVVQFEPRVLLFKAIVYCSIVSFSEELLFSDLKFLWPHSAPDFRKIIRQSYDNLRIFIQYTLILRQIYDNLTNTRNIVNIKNTSM